MVTGFLELITGPVFSGKTSTLINRIKRSSGRCLVLMPWDSSDASGISQLISHNEESFPALCLQNSEAFAKLPFYDWIFMDNIHKFTKPLYQGNILQTIGSMLGKGSVVICAGLDYDYNGKPLPLTEAITQMADAITMLTAKCSECGAEAVFSHQEGEKLLPRCPLHYGVKNSKPKQESA